MQFSSHGAFQLIHSSKLLGNAPDRDIADTNPMQCTSEADRCCVPSSLAAIQEGHHTNWVSMNRHSVVNIEETSDIPLSSPALMQLASSASRIILTDRG